jgi:hypothetical protein
MRTCKYAVVFLLFITLIGGCSQRSKGISKVSPVQYVDADHTLRRETSIIAILADPWRFNGVEVSVRGYVTINRGYAVVTYSEEVIKQHLSADTIYIDYRQCTNAAGFLDNASKKWTKLVGVIDASRGGQPNMEFHSCVLKLIVY